MDSSSKRLSYIVSVPQACSGMVVCRQEVVTAGLAFGILQPDMTSQPVFPRSSWRSGLFDRRYSGLGSRLFHRRGDFEGLDL